MKKDVIKYITINLQLNYTETCNIMRGGIAMVEFRNHELVRLMERSSDYCDDEEEPSVKTLQVNVKIDPESLKHLEFMKVYLENKDKMTFPPGVSPL